MEMITDETIKEPKKQVLFYILRGIYAEGLEDGEIKGKNEFKEKMIKTIKSI